MTSISWKEVCKWSEQLCMDIVHKLSFSKWYNREQCLINIRGAKNLQVSRQISHSNIAYLVPFLLPLMFWSPWPVNTMSHSIMGKACGRSQITLKKLLTFVKHSNKIGKHSRVILDSSSSLKALSPVQLQSYHSGTKKMLDYCFTNMVSPTQLDMFWVKDFQYQWLEHYFW